VPHVNQIAHYNTGDAAFAVDQHGKIVLWNSAAESVLGYPASVALGQRCWKLLKGRDIYSNRYCYERCPIREMSSHHEPVRGFNVLYKTASARRVNFFISCLVVFDDAGKDLLLHVCHPQEELSETGGNHDYSTASTDDELDTLTRRQNEVLRHLADGKGTREIASLMNISMPTVRNHVQQVLRKLKVHTRLDAVIRRNRKPQG
jgi:DNA-binding CsgD family transcriptional regulator